MFIVSAARAHPNITVGITAGGIISVAAICRGKNKFKIVKCGLASGIFAGLAALSFRNLSSPYVSFSVKNLGCFAGGVVSSVAVVVSAINVIE